MSRDKTLDGIFLRNFFKNSIAFFAGEQSNTENEFLHGYNLATNDWISLKAEIDTYPISTFLKEKLNDLFNLAEDYFFCIVGSDQPYQFTIIQSSNRTRWEEIRKSAKAIYAIAQGTNLF